MLSKKSYSILSPAHKSHRTVSLCWCIDILIISSVFPFAQTKLYWSPLCKELQKSQLRCAIMYLSLIAFCQHLTDNKLLKIQLNWQRTKTLKKRKYSKANFDSYKINMTLVLFLCKSAEYLYIIVSEIVLYHNWPS